MSDQPGRRYTRQTAQTLLVRAGCGHAAAPPGSPGRCGPDRPASLSVIKERELKVIASSVPLLGHLNAVLAIGRILVEEGHKVVGLSATAFRERVERIGASFHPFPATADIDTSDMIAAYSEFATLPPGPAMTLFYFKRVFADPLAAQHQGLLDVMKDFKADLIVTDNLFMGALPMLLGPRSARPPIMFCGTTYLLWRRGDKAPCNIGMPPARTESERREYSALAEQVDDVLSNPFRDHLNKCLASVGAPPLKIERSRCSRVSPGHPPATDGAELRISESRSPVFGPLRGGSADHPESVSLAGLGRRSRWEQKDRARHPRNSVQP